MTTRPQGIGGDIRPGLRASRQSRGVRPLPPDMPARRHVVGPAPARRAQPVDQARAAVALPAQAARTAKVKLPKVALAMPPMPRGRNWSIVQYPLIAIVALGAAASPTFGQAMIGIYGLWALISRQASQLTFGLALVMLISVPVFQALGQAGIAQTAAIYVFELLVVGTIQAILELKQTA